MSQTWLCNADSPVQGLCLSWTTYLGFILHVNHDVRATIMWWRVIYYTTPVLSNTPGGRIVWHGARVKFTYGAFPGAEWTGCSPLGNWNLAFNLALSSKRLACSWRGLRGRSSLVTIHLKWKPITYSTHTVGFLEESRHAYDYIIHLWNVCKTLMRILFIWVY